MNLKAIVILMLVNAFALAFPGQQFYSERSDDDDTYEVEHDTPAFSGDHIEFVLDPEDCPCDCDASESEVIELDLETDFA